MSEGILAGSSLSAKACMLRTVLLIEEEYIIIMFAIWRLNISIYPKAEREQS